MMLQALTGLTLTVIEQAGWISAHVTPLNKVQTRILALLGLSPNLYSRLAPHSLEVALELRER
jgi:hypothetical protein